ncbi:MAG: nitronate monooxygenase [Planctomycetota bacterium]|nr:MAG: nitronate monooxygenase [Planctomycetota bacterium]
MSSDDPCPTLETAFTRHSGARVPLICGAMYPCSNPELVGAASAAGALGVVQPISLTYVHGRELRAGLREILRLSGGAPIGFNAIVEASSRRYLERMRRWVDVALDEGVRFFVTALGKPDTIVRAVHEAGGIVYHDVTERRWALKARDAGVDGLICVNRRAGGHAGVRTAEELHRDLADLGLPLVCAGGIGTPAEFRAAIDLGYAACQLGTRFIATRECSAHPDYKRAILAARAEDIVLTEKISGVPVAVIKTPAIERTGTRAGFLARRLLRHPRAKHWVRAYYTLKSIVQLKRSSLRGSSYRDVFQAGQSVEGIHEVLPVAEVVRRFAAALDEANADRAATSRTPKA